MEQKKEQTIVKSAKQCATCKGKLTRCECPKSKNRGYIVPNDHYCDKYEGGADDLFKRPKRG